MRLTDSQAKELIEQQGVEDVDTLISEIEHRNIEEFTRRPQDLIELCADWKNRHKIGTHKEQVAANARVRLKPSSLRPEKASLSPEKALEGASRLALAALLSRKLTLRHNANADSGEHRLPALDPERILREWPENERATLLARPLFGFASYGRVKFQHRSAIEFLAAERILRLIDKGMPIKAVKRLLFGITAQGEFTVRPSMRAVAAWVALGNGSIFNEVCAHEPNVLFSCGDPESLSASQRSKVLHSLMDHFGKGGWRGLQIPWIQIRRFASSEMGPDIKRHWEKGIENPELRELLLNFIEAAKLKDCAEIACDVGANVAYSDTEKINALSALSAIEDNRLISFVEAMAATPKNWPSRVIEWAAGTLFSDRIDVELLNRLLGALSVKPQTVGYITWQLPKTIQTAPLPDGVLNSLRSHLTDLVSENLSWTDGWPNVVTSRAFLIPALAAACTRQVSQQHFSDELFRSCVLVLRSYSLELHGSNQVPGDLREALDEKTSSNSRRSVFDADYRFIRQLKPEAEPFGLFFEVSYHGPLQLKAEKDLAWVLEALGNSSLPNEYRAVMLYAALDLRKLEEKMEDCFAKVREQITDSAALIEIFNCRIRSAPPNPEMEKLEKKSKAYQTLAEQREKKNYASWTKFWNHVVQNPDSAFSKNEQSSTTWDLWKSLYRGRDSGNDLGWNRRLVEQYFNKDIANRLRQSLMNFWREDRPTLRSERKLSENNVTLVRWHVGLAGIAAEAEDRSWAKKLTPDLAKLAARYAPLELNGFPFWLEDLIEYQPTAVDEVLGNELSLEMNEPLGEQGHSITLQSIEYAASAIARQFLPRIEKSLTENLEKFREKVDCVAWAKRLTQIVGILCRHGDEQLKRRLLELAKPEFSRSSSGPVARVWLSLVIRLDMESGITALEGKLVPLPVKPRGEAVTWIGALFGEHQRGFPASLSDTEPTPGPLLRLIRLAYTHVRPIDDQPHDGAYTPDIRDHAERIRDAAVNILINAKGHSAWLAKLEMASDPLFQHFKDRVIAQARDRSAEEADSAIYDEDTIAGLDEYDELPPMTRDDMFVLLTNRLDDLEDLLGHDDSPASTWASTTQEKALRKSIAHELKMAARKAYTVDQEATTAEEKETDIRLRSVGSPHEAIIELKVAEKGRTALELKNTLQDQLLLKYMAPENCRSGCLLITDGTNYEWNHPDTGEKMNLEQLVDFLNSEAKRIELVNGDVRIMARGLRLTPRLPTEAAIRKTQGKTRKPRKTTTTA